MSQPQPKISRRSRALLWFLGAAVVIGTLLFFEQIQILYLVSTLALIVLLLIVAFSDLESVGIEAAENGPNKI